MAGHSKSKTEELTEMVNRSAAAGHYVDGQLAPDQSMTRVRDPDYRPSLGQVNARLRERLAHYADMDELARWMVEAARPPAPDAKAAYHANARECRHYLVSQLIGAPRQTVAVEDARPEDSPGAAMMRAIAGALQVIEGESRVLVAGEPVAGDTAAAGEAVDWAEATQAPTAAGSGAHGLLAR